MNLCGKEIRAFECFHISLNGKSSSASVHSSDPISQKQRVFMNSLWTAVCANWTMNDYYLHCGDSKYNKEDCICNDPHLERMWDTGN
ncbi:uncharacterized protein G2W53_018382 [Senna tora]|uniref:Uncharacterized protein n=1 Tax=Senna tora TaxID=362788 RepID=A0A834TRP2_9FABA|nr:uncharacterized protein G2W53_018382 [Senna tora]